MPYSVVLVSATQQSESSVCTCMALPPEQPFLVPHPTLPGLSYDFMFLSIYDFIYYDFMGFFDVDHFKSLY